ncbi:MULTISPECIES: DUF4142 domain-containing protein [unclassified Acidiphilium]|jgi:predicted outer membrane protein|uniref:DUF4142 domain-containing protein n=1 Tax=unclassified Acidiphilium TaxID=2617493 RepID=UPI000BDAF8D2|nr:MULTISPECIES: DUF4142 domain-containing protein [unclassified Acidiphilium]OYV57036.1 MAG: hypothetical protein B7Z76_03745 [Acidiphilium sp. 20-67-58]HQT61795.1 DUF4142 domain-containing protein [Acidiphilium sp.]
MQAATRPVAASVVPLDARGRAGRARFRLAALGALLALGGCATTAEAPLGAALGPTDLAFVTTASQLVNFDLDACSFVRRGPIEPTARAAVEQVCADAATYAPRLQALAAREGVRLPTALPFDLKEKLVSLNYHPQPNLTVEFLRDEIGSHESAIAVFQGELREGRNQAFQQTARDGLPVLERNLAMLRAALPPGMAE